MITPVFNEQEPFKVLFVCTGNICRSPLAHTLFDSMAGEMGLQGLCKGYSGGLMGYHIGEDADPRTRANARGHGYPFSHPAHKVELEDIEDADLVLAMDRGHLRGLTSMVKGRPELLAKLKLYRSFDPLGGPNADVPDPYYGESQDFEEVFQIIHRTTKALLQGFELGDFS